MASERIFQQGNLPNPPTTPMGQPLPAATPTQAVYIPPPPVIRPSSPTMGTCQETYPGSKSFYFEFGGKPKADWTGIENTGDRIGSDLCFRSLDPVAGQKSTHYRTKGLSTKFDVKQSITDFQSNVWDHLVKYGLDTIGYLPNPKDENKALCVVTKHCLLYTSPSPRDRG